MTKNSQNSSVLLIHLKNLKRKFTEFFGIS